MVSRRNGSHAPSMASWHRGAIATQAYPDAAGVRSTHLPTAARQPSVSALSETEADGEHDAPLARARSAPRPGPTAAHEAAADRHTQTQRVAGDVRPADQLTRVASEELASMRESVFEAVTTRSRSTDPSCARCTSARKAPRSSMP